MSEVPLYAPHLFGPARSGARTAFDGGCLFSRGARVQGYLAHKKTLTPPGTPLGP